MKGTVGSVEVVNVSTFKPALDLEGLLRLVVHLEPIIPINLSTIQIVPREIAKTRNYRFPEFEKLRKSHRQKSSQAKPKLKSADQHTSLTTRYHGSRK